MISSNVWYRISSNHVLEYNMIYHVLFDIPDFVFLNLERVVSKALFSHRLAVQNLGRTSCRTVLLKTSYTPSTCFGGVPVPT